MNKTEFGDAVKMLKAIRDDYGEHVILQKEARDIFDNIGSKEGSEAVSKIAAIEATYCEQIRDAIDKVLEELTKKRPKVY